MQISANTETTIEKASAAREPSFALALGGGGARGIAHIHVLEVLDELGIKPNLIAGSSIGAIMGAAYCSGMSGKDIRAYTLELLGKRGATLANRLWKKNAPQVGIPLDGLGRFQFSLPSLLCKLLPASLPGDVADLPLPLKVVATDYYGLEEVVITSGPLHQALAASAAVPGFVKPVRFNGRIMIDGALFNPVPYEHVIDSADITIGVDIIGCPEGAFDKVPSRIESSLFTAQVLMQAAVKLKLQMRAPQIYLRPKISRFKVMDFLKAREVLKETEDTRDELKRAIEREVEAFYRKERG